MEASTFPDIWVVEDLQQQKLPARCIVSALQRAGVGTRLVDLNQGAADLVATAQREQPRLILASILFADRVDEHLALMTAMRAAGVHARLALTGHLPALAAKTFLNACPALDSVLCGEGEQIATDLAESLGHAKGWEKVPGVVGRHANAAIGPPRSSPNLEELAFPSYDALALFGGYGYATIEASRGCYHACAFCLPRAFYARCAAPYRSRSVPCLIQEIGELYQRGVRLFLFDDEQFLPPGRARHARVEALAEEIEQRHLQIAFTMKCRADDVEPGLFRLLKEMGLVRVFVGIESGCQATLDILGKQTTVQQNVDALATLHELGIVADWRALAFHPWSALESLETESAFLHCVSAQLATVVDWREVQVYAGTPLAERLSLEARGGGSPFRFRSKIPEAERRGEGGRGVRSADVVNRLLKSRGGDAQAWSIPYTIPDPRAEVVRRLSRLVFCSDAYRRLCDAVTEAWYEILFVRRMQAGQSRDEVEAEAGLRAVVARANEESLKVWEEMLAFAETGNVYSAEEVNARASEWVRRVTFAARTGIADMKPSRVAKGGEHLSFP